MEEAWWRTGTEESAAFAFGISRTLNKQAIGKLGTHLSIESDIRSREQPAYRFLVNNSGHKQAPGLRFHRLVAALTATTAGIAMLHSIQASEILGWSELFINTG